MKKNLFLTFCFSFIPGAGQMYQKYMKRGLSIMCLLGVFVILSGMFDSAIFAIPSLIIWAYSFFDTYNLRNMNDEERANYIDDYVWTDFLPVKKIELTKSTKIIGILLVAFGVYFLGYEILRAAYDNFSDAWIECLYFTYSRKIPAIFVALACAIGGMKMIKK